MSASELDRLPWIAAATDGRETLVGKSMGWHDAFFGNLYKHVLANQFSAAQTKVQLAMVRRLLRLPKPM